MTDTPKTKTQQLRDLIEEKKAEIRQATVERALLVREGNEETAPLLRERQRIENQRTVLKEASAEDLAEMGLSKQQADQKWRDLEEPLAAARAKLKERTLYHQERVDLVTERIEAAQEAIRRAEDRLALYA